VGLLAILLIVLDHPRIYFIKLLLFNLLFDYFGRIVLESSKTLHMAHLAGFGL
jgi:hypothetical protein